LFFQRRTYALLAACALLLSTAPHLARASTADDKVILDKTDPAHPELHMKSSPEKKGPTTATYISDNLTVNFHSEDAAQVDWPKIWPQNGKANALIDDKGNWQFTGSFPAQPEMKNSNKVTITFVLSGTNKNGIGQAVAMTDEFVVTKNGGSFSKTGHDQVVQDLWPVVVTGHTHDWLTHTHRSRPRNRRRRPRHRRTAAAAAAGAAVATASRARSAASSRAASPASRRNAEIKRPVARRAWPAVSVSLRINGQRPDTDRARLARTHMKSTQTQGR